MKKKFLWLSLFIPFLFYENKTLSISEYELSYEKLPKSFDGFKIVQISDIHDTLFGKKQKKLIKKIINISPDIIFITGDIINRDTKDFKKAFYLIDGLKSYNIIYVTGNHEADNKKRNEFLKELKKHNVIVLDGKKIDLCKNNEKIAVCGLRSLLKNKRSVYKEKLEEFCKVSENEFTILLSHRPDAFEEYIENNINLTFSGHAHGGQIRLPFTEGLFAPNQGFLPKYTSGVFEKNEAKMVVNRGIGKGAFPFRIFNRPEIVKVTLKSKT